ncbi:MAG: hypothetical protein FWD98_02670 [Defluviitaleaceae bacterium]|nr:hypothetical protein [Defluviitaleaceae bacterium]
MGLDCANGVSQVAALFALNDLINLYNEEWRGNRLKIVVLSGYFLAATTQGIVVRSDLGFNSAIISILYGIAAFAWIISGFCLIYKS